MNKTAIKNFAVWARTTLIDAVKQKAYEYEVTKDAGLNPNQEIISGRPLSNEEFNQRSKLISQIQNKGFDQVMEEVAYTWFNRFIALRFMEVNGYLPSGVRVFTTEAGEFKPDILKEALTVELNLDREKVLELLDKQDNEGLYKLLLIAQCNDLSAGLPGMFQTIDNWTELLFPSNLLKQDSVLGQMVTMIPEEDWLDQVQIIGWLYQYYNSEKKDEVFAGLKKNIKITKENIPAATQLFTPDWIVRYMVENSLGRLWTEGHPDTKEQFFPTKEEQDAYIADKSIDDGKWHYYLEEAEQEPQVQVQLDEIRKEYAKLNPEDIRCIDPCCGSGHILTYLFDVLMQIYTSSGWSERDAARSILENNLYGLDIDDRAGQLAYFAVMMKARKYDRRILTRGIHPHVKAIVECKAKGEILWGYLGEEETIGKKLYETFLDAKEYGSILTPDLTLEELDTLDARLTEADKMTDFGSLATQSAVLDLINLLDPLMEQARMLVQKYHVVVTNPPYMGGGNMNTDLSDFVKEHYPNSKTDLFSVFIERCETMTKINGYQAMITMQSWMFLQSFKNLRASLLQSCGINSMVHLGMRAFAYGDVGTIVQTTSFVLNKHRNYKGVYIRAVDEQDGDKKEQRVLSIVSKKSEGIFIVDSALFEKLPNTPIAYWANPKICDAFASISLTKIGDIKTGVQTGNNELFLKLWYEVCIDKICFDAHSLDEYLELKKKWIPQVKGGEFRRWYGNFDYILNWQNDGAEIRKCNSSRLNAMLDGNNGFREGISWSHTSDRFGVRFQPQSIMFNVEAPSFFPRKENDLYVVLGFLNSKVARYCMDLLNSTVHFLAGDVKQLPFLLIIESKRIERIVNECIAISKTDWDSFETSWDFEIHPLVRLSNGLWDATAIGASMHHYYGGHPKVSCPLELCFMLWQGECNERFNQLKVNEEELNRIFIDIYGLQDELTPEVEDKDVTVRKADLGRDIRSFISYAVGCMVGRYSLDVEGLAYAGGEWDDSKYRTFIPDKDNVLPIFDDDYLEDDIVGRFVKFVEVVYGKETLEENLKFIADALGGKGQPREVIRNYFLKDFFKDHCKIYQKRPIYWLFDSGKKNGFKCLIYMHRYQPDTIARIRTDYIHELQSRYKTAISDIEEQIEKASPNDRVKLNKQLSKLKDQDTELLQYEEKIHHLADQMIDIDLDDGVKVNYAKFGDVLAKIK